MVTTMLVRMSKLKGRQIDEGEKKATIIFSPSCERVVPIGRESYNPIVATYFTGNEHEHYILHSRYLISKEDGKQKV